MGGTESIPKWSSNPTPTRRNSFTRCKSDGSLTTYPCEDQRKSKRRNQKKSTKTENLRNSFNSTSTAGTSLSLPVPKTKKRGKRTRKPKSSSVSVSSTDTPSSWSRMGFKSKSTANLKLEEPKRRIGPSQKRLSLETRGLPQGFACNPIMVNFTRSQLGFSVLQRSTRLDMIAHQHACEMAAMDQLFSFLEKEKRHNLQDEVMKSLLRKPNPKENCHNNSQLAPSRRLRRTSAHRVLAEGDEDDEFFRTMIVGENLQCGKSIIKMHHKGLTKSEIGKNLTEANYREMGMGTAKSETGELYMCQLFR